MSKDTDKGKEGKVVTAPQSPSQDTETEAIGLKSQKNVLIFQSIYSDMCVQIIPSRMDMENGIKRPRPGFKAQFENFSYTVSPSDRWKDGNREITGDMVIEALRSAPKFGDTFWEVQMPTQKTEDTKSLIARLRGMDLTKIRSEAAAMGIDVKQAWDKNDIILEVIQKITDKNKEK